MHKELRFFFFIHSVKYKKFSNRSIRPIDGTLTDTIIPGQSEPESNGSGGVLHTPQICSLTTKSHLVPHLGQICEYLELKERSKSIETKYLFKTEKNNL